MYQYFQLTLECGHIFETTALKELNQPKLKRIDDGEGKFHFEVESETTPYDPDYTKETLMCRAFCGPQKVKTQQTIGGLTGKV